jgi:acyl carrier protein
MKLNELVARVLREPVENLTDESSPDSVKGWDSFNHIQLMVALEETYRVRFTTVEMDGMKSLGRLKDALSKRGIPIL